MAVTFEHLDFPGLDRDEAVLLERELEQVEGAARLFAAGLTGVDVHTSWSLGRSRPSRWMRAPDGGLAVHIWVNLLSPRNLPVDEAALSGDRRQVFVASFRNGFLHALGRVLESPSVWQEQRSLGEGEAGRLAADPPAPLEVALRPHHPRWRRLPAAFRARLREGETRSALEGLVEYLEGSRTDGLLVRRFRGAAGHLRGRVAEARRLVHDGDAAMALGGLVSLELRHALLPEDRARAPREAARCFALLQEVLRMVRAQPSPAAAYPLAELALYDLMPLLLELTDDLPAVAAAQDEGAEGAGRARPVRVASEGVTHFRGTPAELSGRTEEGVVGTAVVALPHVEGGEALFRIDRADAHCLFAGDPIRPVLKGLRDQYGPPAVEAFAAEAGPLRAALQVNWERRRRGRHRTGKHVGIPNLRRFLVSDDLRLFQRVEAPEELSYYFHLLVDVSYSMLEEHKAEKAIAVAYGFTDLLATLRVPVGVTLYSSGVTDLFDSNTDRLEPWFGADFGYLLAGTLEMEAIGYARLKTASRPERRKVFVIVTDGTPATPSLSALGAADLGPYYADTLIPWLARDRIDLVAVGIGVQPDYHPRAVSLSDSWDSIAVFIELLDEMVREGTQRTRELWQ